MGFVSRMLVPVLIATLTSVASAAPPPDRERARPLFKEGIRCFDRKDYGCALSSYRKAYAIFPSPKISMNIALTLEAMGEAAGAAEHYERFLLEAAERRKKGEKGWNRNRIVHRKLKALRGKLGSVTLACRLAGALVLVDGERRGKTALRHRLYMVPGEHKLRVKRGGYKSWLKRLTVAAGQHLKVEVPAGALRRELVKAPSRKPKEGEADGPPIYKRWWFWTAVGAGVLAVAGGVTAGVLLNQDAPDPELGAIRFD